MEELFSPDEDLTVAGELVRVALWYRSLSYKTQNSWNCARRVVTKAAYDSQGLKMRVVTSLPTAKIPPRLLYTNKYCPRGDMENRIKEQQLELFSDGLLHIHLRATNSGFGSLPLLMFSYKPSVNSV
jgi:anion-transporting  ArsA/GET3 family ATPase